MFNLKDLQNFMAHDEMQLPLISPDMLTWGKFMKRYSYSDDGLVALRSRQTTDAFTSALSERLINVLHFFKKLYRGHEKDNPMNGYRNSTISKFTLRLTCFIASIITLCSIIALANSSTFESRLTTIAGSNVAVSLCLVCFTEARRIDIFSVTAV